MGEQDLIQTADSLLEAFAAKDWDSYKSFLAPDVVYDEKATGRSVRGADQMIEAVKAWTTAFPDLRGTRTNAVACGDIVVFEGVWEGTQTGPLAGSLGTIPPSGKFGRVPAAQVITFENGKVKELRHYFDLVTILQQIGALPVPALAGTR